MPVKVTERVFGLCQVSQLPRWGFAGASGPLLTQPTLDGETYLVQAVQRLIPCVRGIGFSG